MHNVHVCAHHFVIPCFLWITSWCVTDHRLSRLASNVCGQSCHRQQEAKIWSKQKSDSKKQKSHANKKQGWQLERNPMKRQLKWERKLLLKIGRGSEGVSCSSQPVPNLCPLVRHPLTPQHFAPCGRRLSFGIPRGCERGTFRCPNPLLSPFVCLFFRCTCGRAGSSMSSMLIEWAGFNSSTLCLTANGSFSSIVSSLLASQMLWRYKHPSHVVICCLESRIRITSSLDSRTETSIVST